MMPLEIAARLCLSAWGVLTLQERAALEAIATLYEADAFHEELRARAERFAERVEDPATRATLLREIAGRPRPITQSHARRSALPRRPDLLEIMRTLVSDEDDETVLAHAHPKPLTPGLARRQLREALQEKRRGSSGRRRASA